MFLEEFQGWQRRSSGTMYNPETLFGVLLFFEIISVLAIQKTRVTRHFKAEVSNFLLRKFWVPS